MSGIEFYPQKEFDEDMEDKSDNDKIRVRATLCRTHDLNQLIIATLLSRIIRLEKS